MFDSQISNSLASLAAGSLVALVDLRPDSRPMCSLLLAVILELARRGNLFNSNFSLLWGRLRWHFADDPIPDSNFVDLQLTVPISWTTWSPIEVASTPSFR
jgi:hypothetical protein